MTGQIIKLFMSADRAGMTLRIPAQCELHDVCGFEPGMYDGMQYLTDTSYPSRLVSVEIEIHGLSDITARELMQKVEYWPVMLASDDASCRARNEEMRTRECPRVPGWDTADRLQVEIPLTMRDCPHTSGWPGYDLAVIYHEWTAIASFLRRQHINQKMSGDRIHVSYENMATDEIPTFPAGCVARLRQAIIDVPGLAKSPYARELDFPRNWHLTGHHG